MSNPEEKKDAPRENPGEDEVEGRKGPPTTSVPQDGNETTSVPQDDK